MSRQDGRGSTVWERKRRVADTVLITGGAGFIGCHLARALLRRGHHVRVLDCLLEQVHGNPAQPPPLDRDAEMMVGDVRDPCLLRRALKGVTKVVHLAAEVGVGQSMYAVERYVSVNDSGTAALLQQLIERPVERVVVASSMSIYGEGLYRDADGALHEAVTRGPHALGNGWDPLDAQGRPLIPVPTPEDKRPSLASVYAITKFAQERLTLTLGAAYAMGATALRLWNVYGPGQALSNPYTGVLAIFASRIRNGQRPMVFEDGGQRRDFVHVEDVAHAFMLALDHPRAVGQVFNVASGVDRSVNDVAQALARAMGKPDVSPEITGKARSGDIRHNIADIGRIQRDLGFSVARDFDADLVELAEWVARQQAEDRVALARQELEQRGLVA